MREVVLERKLVGLWDWESLNFSLGFNDGKFFFKYQDRIKQFGWSSVFGLENIPMVPVYELPSKLKGKHQFVVIDGNRRVFHCDGILDFMPFYLFDKNEPVDFEKFNIKLFETKPQELYEKTIRKYEYFMNRYH